MTTPSQVVCLSPEVDQEQQLTASLVVDNKMVAACKGDCKITFSYTATPQIQALVPSAGSPGQEIQFFGVQRVSSMDNIDYLKIGEFRCNFVDKIEYNPINFNPADDSPAPCDVPKM